MAKLGEANIGGRMVPAWLLNLTAEELDSLKWYSNPNLLDNWYFVGGGSQQGGGQFPINQRGKTSYNTPGYVFDRWKLDGGSLELTSDGISFTSGYVLHSTLENISFTDGQQRTVSYMDENGDVFSGPFTPGYTTVGNYAFCYAGTESNFYCKAITEAPKIKAMKLELGSTQTLAHQEGEKWVLNEIPDYGEELAKCQRYLYSPYYSAFPTAPIGTVFVSNQTTGFVVVKTPVLMRTKPVFSGDPSKLWIVKSNGGGAQRSSALSVMGMSGCGVFLFVTASFEDGGQYIMYSEDVSNPADFLLSAEL